MVTKSIDPVGRETVFEYAANEIDLLRVKQWNDPNYELLQEFGSYANHRPQTVTDAAGQTTMYTYNAAGQLETVTTPERAGISENRTTTYSFDADGYPESVTGPAAGATTSYTYDGFGRVRTVTDSDGYTLTFAYDDFDRMERVSYPDLTFEETVYEKLDVIRVRDRAGRWNRRFYDPLRRLTSTRDALGRTVAQDWCRCGSLDALFDANGNATRWERDIQGRVTTEIRANGSQWLYVFEPRSSRLKSVTDPKAQVKTYAYFLDDNLNAVSYTNEEHETPNVSFTYDAVYDRVKTMVDGTGTTSYSYHPITATPPLGAGRLATVDGPLTDDAISYTYDELGREESRAIDGVALSYEYDALGRITEETNALGTFTYEYQDVTSRSSLVTYPNGQTTSYSYYGNIEDRRLLEMHHRGSSGMTLSKFRYTYDVVGNILTWTQQADADPPKAYDFEYDDADQLRAATWRTTAPTPTILKRYRYVYDPAGNRTVEQIDDVPVLASYDEMNRLQQHVPGGDLRFAGSLSEQAMVTIESAPATVTPNNRFELGVPVPSGTNQVDVQATDVAGNTRTNTYEVGVSGSSKTFTFDDNGNVVGDGTTTFTWDAENSLLSATRAGQLYVYRYDGFGRRVGQQVKVDGELVSDTAYVWCSESICGERELFGGNSSSLHFDLGVQRDMEAYFLTKDHLGSAREVLDTSNLVRARYDYGPYGRRTKVSGDEETIWGFAGLAVLDPTVQLATYRAYVPEVGRWTSEDPIGLNAGPNFYAYADWNPTRYTDVLGLEVQVCNRPADLPFPLSLVDHKWLKTGSQEAGMGNARGNVPVQEDEPLDLPYSRTETADHSGQAAAANARCYVIESIDEDCVDELIRPGRYTGRWAPWNNCWTFTQEVIIKCKIRMGPWGEVTTPWGHILPF